MWQVGRYECECPRGKTGLRCHLDDECVLNPCRGAARCDTNRVTGARTCTCPPGYTGENCQQDVDECQDGATPCEHDGQCVNTLGSYTCRCPQVQLLVKLLPKFQCKLQSKVCCIKKWVVEKKNCQIKDIT